MQNMSAKNKKAADASQRWVRRIEQLCSSVPDVRETVAAPLPHWSEEERSSGIRSTGFCGFRAARAHEAGARAGGCAFCGQDREDRPDQ
jgi:hypothetical protein